jgi:glutathione peroxidase
MKLYDFQINDLSGRPFELQALEGKKVLLVNTASECGSTPQYSVMQELYETFGGDKFEIIAIPSNDFGNQEPGTAQQIAEFCQNNYAVSFPVLEKVKVLGEQAHPVFVWLQDQAKKKVAWNFFKFLIDEEGNMVKMLHGELSPADPQILDWINE